MTAAAVTNEHELNTRLCMDDLKICAALKREADELGEQIARLRSALECAPRPTYGSCGARKPGAGYDDRMASMVAALVDLEALYTETAHGYYTHVRMVELSIAALKRPESRRAMRLRFIMGHKWEDIARKMHFDERTVRRLCERALLEMGIPANKAAQHCPASR